MILGFPVHVRHQIGRAVLIGIPRLHISSGDQNSRGLAFSRIRDEHSKAIRVLMLSRNTKRRDHERVSRSADDSSKCEVADRREPDLREMHFTSFRSNATASCSSTKSASSFARAIRVRVNVVPIGTNFNSCRSSRQSAVSLRLHQSIPRILNGLNVSPGCSKLCS
jgi:hypothetical protein